MNSDKILSTLYIDTLLKKINRWRFLAFFLILLFIGQFFLSSKSDEFTNNGVAEVFIDGFLVDDLYRNEQLNKIANSDNIKALIVNINSPGGSFVGGESIHKNLRDIAVKKPVIAILSEIATSAAYLSAIGADYIVARKGTLTGSVGVLLQSFEITNLAKKIGIEPIILQSSHYKAIPHFAKKSTEKGRLYLQSLINDSNKVFLDIVKERRKNIKGEQYNQVKLAKVFIGVSALKIGLIDELGDKQTAKKWLKKKNIDVSNIFTIHLKSKPTALQGVLNSFVNSKLKLQNSGLLSYFNF